MATAVELRLERWIERQQEIFDVGRSFVLATCVSVASGIGIRERYQDARKRRNKPLAKKKG